MKNNHHMASAFGHAVAAFTVVKMTGKSESKLIILAILSSILPDADVLGFKFGIPYGAALGHRGFTHSLLFAFLWTFLLTLIFFGHRGANRIKIFLTLFSATVSHGILDAMTSGGKGVGFFIPFDRNRYFFPFRPIEVSPIKVGRFFEQAQHILLSEFTWIGMPCLAILGVSFFIKKMSRQKTALR